MIVVIDANVWVSALAYGGIPERAVQLASRNHSIRICPSISEEVVPVLHDKIGWRRLKAKAALAKLLQPDSMVRISGALHGVCRDPNDDMVLECALVGDATFILTGDKDLLSISMDEVAILLPVDFLKTVERSAASGTP